MCRFLSINLAFQCNSRSSKASSVGAFFGFSFVKCQKQKVWGACLD